MKDGQIENGKIREVDALKEANDEQPPKRRIKNKRDKCDV